MAETADYKEVYVTDTVSSSLSRVLTMTVYEKADAGIHTTGTTVTYLYGQGLIAEEVEGLYLYHHYNNLGSTMKLSNGEGQVVASYTYGTYGELLSGNTALTHYLYNGRCGVSTDDNGLYYMRQRYYNAEIKRFINQDILTGSISNSQSLNRYSYVQGNPVSYTDPFGLSPINGLFSNTNFAHAVFGLLSCIPGGVGAAFSLVDAGIYLFIDKDYGMAALCTLNAVSFGLGKVATLMVNGGKMTRTASLLMSTSNLLSNATSFGMNAMAGMQTAFSMYDKYVIQGQSFDQNTPAEFLALGMSLAGCLISGRGIGKSTKELGGMLSDAGFTNALKREFGGFASRVKDSYVPLNNGGYVNLGGSGVGGGTPSSKVWDYSKQFNGELANFNLGYQIKMSTDKDLYLVQFHSSAELGKGRSLKYWTTLDEANSMNTIDDYMDRMALLSNWGARDNVSIAKIPAGTNVKYAIGTARAQASAIESRPGGGFQLLFEQFDESWIINTRSLR